MKPIRYIHTILLLGIISLTTILFFNLTPMTLIRSDHTIQLIRYTQNPVQFLEIISPVFYFAVWILGVFYSRLHFGLPLSWALMEIEARSFCLFFFLNVDLVRFFPQLSGLWIPHTLQGLIIQRYLLITIYLFALIWQKYYLHKALSKNSPHSGISRFKLPVFSIAIIPATWLIASLTESVWKFPEANYTVQKEYKACDTAKWLAVTGAWRIIKAGDQLEIPSGKYEFHLNEEVTTGYVFSSPVMTESAVSESNRAVVELPLDTHQLAVKFDSPSTERHRFFVKPIELRNLNPFLRQWIPRNADSRFNEIPLPYPWESYLYRLDTNSYPMESDGFWIKSNQIARFTILSKQKLKFLDLTISSLTDVTVDVTQGKFKQVFSISKNNSQSLGLSPVSYPITGQLYAIPFQIEVTGGAQPFHHQNQDDRSLGTYLRLLDNKVDPFWYLAANGSFSDLLGTILSRIGKTDDMRWKPYFLYHAFLGASDAEEKDSMLRFLTTVQPESLQFFLESMPSELTPETKMAIVREIEVGRILNCCDFLDRKIKESSREYSLGTNTSDYDLKPGEIKFGERLEFHGRISCSGRILKIQTMWKLLDFAADDYVNYIHVIPSGEGYLGKIFRKVSEKILKRHTSLAEDRVILENIYPARCWIPSDTMSETLNIQIPDTLPSGMYDVRIGVYEKTTRQKQLTSDESDCFLGTITIN